MNSIASRRSWGVLESQYAFSSEASEREPTEKAVSSILCRGSRVAIEQIRCCQLYNICPIIQYNSFRFKMQVFSCRKDLRSSIDWDIFSSILPDAAT